MCSSTYCSRHAPPATRTDQLATSVFPLAIKRDACVFGFAFVLCSCSVVWLAGVFVCLASGLFSGINYELGTIIPRPQSRSAAPVPPEARPGAVGRARRA